MGQRENGRNTSALGRASLADQPVPSRPATLLPPPRARGREEAVDFGAVMRAPIDLPQFERIIDDGDLELTPAPQVISGSVAPVAMSSRPGPIGGAERNDAGAARGWRVATYALAATLVLGGAVVGATRLASWQPGSPAYGMAMQPAGAAEPPTLSVNDLPVVGVVEEGAPPAEAEGVVAAPVREGAEAEPGSPELVPGSPKLEPPELEPGSPELEPGSPKLEPGSPELEPRSPALEPGSPELEPGSPADPPPEAIVALPPFDRAAATAALSAAAGAAAACREVGSPSGATRVSVTFAPSGRVTTATVAAGQYAGTSVGGCIARAMRSARVEPFAGELVTVHKTVSLP